MKKNRTVIFMCVLVAFCSHAKAQVTEAEKELRKQKEDSAYGWKHGGVVALNFSQMSLTNWAAGGQNSFALNGLLSLYSNYVSEKSFWDNSIDMGYGLMRQGGKGDYMKTDDKLDVLSKYGLKARESLFYAAMVNFKTQFTEGKDYKTDTSRISDFMSPAYLVGALGMDYKPSAHFSAFLAPVTEKLTIVNDQVLADSGAYGVDPAIFDEQGLMVSHGAKLKQEFGGYLRVIFTKGNFESAMLKNMSFTTKIDLFSNYLHNPQNIDVSWETQLAFKINKFFSANFNTHLIYDDDIDIEIDNDGDGIVDEKGPRLQFKEILAVGITYTF